MARGESVFPAWADRLQVRYMNPVFRRLAPTLPGFAVLEHRGRRTHKLYSTPVNAFTSGRMYSFGMGHGRSDWVKNILAAGEAGVRHRGRYRRLTHPRVLTRDDSKVGCPLPVRILGRRFEILVMDAE